MASYTSIKEEDWVKRYFVECDEYVWSIGDRNFANGLKIEQGSDWFCLHSSYVEYLTKSNDSYLNYLKDYFSNSIVPSEVFCAHI